MSSRTDLVWDLDKIGPSQIRKPIEVAQAFTINGNGKFSSSQHSLLLAWCCLYQLYWNALMFRHRTGSMLIKLSDCSGLSSIAHSICFYWITGCVTKWHGWLSHANGSARVYLTRVSEYPIWHSRAWTVTSIDYCGVMSGAGSVEKCP